MLSSFADTAGRKTKRVKVRASLSLLTLLWFAGIIGGGRYMLRYDTTPGLAATPEARWPGSTTLQRATDRCTIVMIAQPACTCSRASIGELETLISQHPGQAKLFVVFERSNIDVDIHASALWEAATHIPDATLLPDDNGKIAASFHAATSGQTFVFDRNGTLRFSGGVTASRGHGGESDGTRAIGRLLLGDASVVDSTPVFGCSLH